MIENDAPKSKTRAAIDKARGLTKGVPDLFLSIPSGKWHGLYLEMKTDSGRLSKEQISFMDTAEQLGYMARVIRSEKRFHEIVGEYLKDSPWVESQN